MPKTIFLNTDCVKQVDKGDKLRISGYANTVDKDRTNDVILPEAWVKGVENYRRNPVILFQHNHSNPIGKATQITVDKKGLYIEAEISKSDAKIHELIQDGALKAFSVGFQTKDADYDKRTDTMKIKELELLEISVVTVPANQTSLFSVRKSFENDVDYEAYKKNLIKDLEEVDTTKEKAEEKLIVSEEVSDDPLTPIPMVNLLTRSFAWVGNTRYQVEENTMKQVDVQGVIQNDTELAFDSFEVVNKYDLNTVFDLHLVKIENQKDYNDIERSKIKEDVSAFIKYSVEEVHNTETKSEEEQKVLNKVKLLLSTDNWDNSHYNLALNHVNIIKGLLALPKTEARDRALSLHGYKEEIKNMSNTHVEESNELKLVEELGSKMLKSDEGVSSSSEAKALSEEIDRLKAELKSQSEKVAAFHNEKVRFQEENSKSADIVRKQSNLLLVAKALRRDPNELKIGQALKEKAIIADAHLTEAFSTDIYGELQQALTVAPLFNRIQVNERSFRVPVSNEAVEDYVAQFPSGVFADSVASTLVPVGRQNTIKAVELTPHKFMVATPISKDETEDTIIPLIDYIRQSAVRRLSRGLDKALLRGDGSLSTFTQNNTLTAGSGYPSVIEGVVQRAIAASLTVTTGATDTKFTPTHIAEARVRLGKYGLQLGENLVLMTSVEGYNNLVTYSDFQTVDKFGSQATYLTGSVGAIYGIPVVITEFLDMVGGATRALAALVYKPGFLIAERRAMEIESEYLPERQVTSMYVSTRLDMQPLTTETNSALSNQYSMAAVIRTTNT